MSKDVWYPTVHLRLVERHAPPEAGLSGYRRTQVLQQEWINGKKREWRDVPVAEEGK